MVDPEGWTSCRPHHQLFKRCLRQVVLESSTACNKLLLKSVALLALPCETLVSAQVDHRISVACCLVPVRCKQPWSPWLKSHAVPTCHGKNYDNCHAFRCCTRNEATGTFSEDMSLKEDLGQLLVTLSPRTRLRLEKKCLIDTHPLQLFAVLSDATATAAVRQLAGVLLAKQIPSYWSIGPVSERLKLQNGLLVALDSLDCDGAVIRSLVDCTACLANCLAIDGVAWQDLFLWMRGIASETRLTNGVGTHCGHNHCSSFSSTSPAAPAGYSQSCLQSSQSIRKRRAFLYLLDRLLESAPWKDFLEPHVMELSELLYRMAMLARTKGDGISDGMQEDEFACSKHALESLGSLASVVRGEDDAQVFHYRIVQVLLSHEIIGSELCESALEALSRAAAADELLIADTSFYNPALAPEELCPVVRLGLSASVTQRGQRRNLALRLLHSIADSHSRLLCTSRGGQLSADEVLRILIEDVAPDEVRLKSFDSDGPFPVEAASAAEWGCRICIACSNFQTHARQVDSSRDLQICLQIFIGHRCPCEAGRVCSTASRSCGMYGVCQEAAAKDCQACFESVDGFATTRGDLRANSRSLWLDSCGNTLRILSSGREATSTAVAAAADITASRRSLPSCSWRLRSRLSKNSTWTGQRQNRQDRTLSGFRSSVPTAKRCCGHCMDRPKAGRTSDSVQPRNISRCLGWHCNSSLCSPYSARSTTAS